MSTAPLLERVRPAVRDLPAYNAGLSAEYVRRTYGVAHVAKLGSNENPLGASPAVATALGQIGAELAQYPDPACGALSERLAAELGIHPARLIFGNGSEDLIAIAAHTFLAPGDEVVTITPAFGLHTIYPAAAGARVVTVPLRPDFTIDVERLIAAVSPDTRMLILSNPSNPVGSALCRQDMQRLLAALSPATLVLWDEAYYEYAATDADYPDGLQLLGATSLPWLLLRTFSKAYGLAGLRIGYGVAADSAMLELMHRMRTPFNVNRLAQSAALAALDDRAHLRASVRHATDERERIGEALRERGYRVAPSHANFVFFDTGEHALSLARRLLERGVIVKPWLEPGYQRCMRVSVGSRADNDLFLAALHACASIRPAQHPIDRSCESLSKP